MPKLIPLKLVLEELDRARIQTEDLAKITMEVARVGQLVEDRWQDGRIAIWGERPNRRGREEIKEQDSIDLELDRFGGPGAAMSWDEDDRRERLTPEERGEFTPEQVGQFYEDRGHPIIKLRGGHQPRWVNLAIPAADRERLRAELIGNSGAAAEEAAPESPSQSKAETDLAIPVADREREPTASVRTWKRRGPKPGTLDRYRESDRALFPDLEQIRKEQQVSPTAAARMLAAEGKVSGYGTPENRARRLVARFLKEPPKN